MEGFTYLQFATKKVATGTWLDKSEVYFYQQ